MMRAAKPLSVIVYQDVLCAWSYLAGLRMESVARDLSAVVRVHYRSFPLRLHDALPSPQELKSTLRELDRAKREPEGKALTAELWSSADLPRSSMPALAAVEAARLQGPERARQLAVTMQRVALEQGVNVTRSDVVFELASRLGLQMNRFAAAYGAPQTRKLILEEHRIAHERGVRGVPTVVVGARWMISGLREVGEYREHLLGCLAKLERAPDCEGEPTVH